MRSGKIQLNLGCGILLRSGFINVDKFLTLRDLQEGERTKTGPYREAVIEKDAEFVQADLCKLPFKDNYAEYIECNQTIEHLACADVLKAIKEMRRVLKLKKTLLITTPNFDDLVKRWHEGVSGLNWSETVDREFVCLAEAFYGNQRGPGEFHCTPFNPSVLKVLLIQAGFQPEAIKIIGFPVGYTGKLPYLAGLHPVPSHEIKNGVAIATNRTLRDETIFAFAKK